MLLARIARITPCGPGISRRELNQRSGTGASPPACLDASTSLTAVVGGRTARGDRRVSGRAPRVASIVSSRHIERQHQRGRSSCAQRRHRFRSMATTSDDDSTHEEDGDEHGAMAATSSQRTVAIAGLAVAAVIVVVYLSRQGFSIQQTADAIQNAVKDHPTVGPLIFIAAYAIAAVVLIPGAPVSSLRDPISIKTIGTTAPSHDPRLCTCSVSADPGRWIPVRPHLRHGNRVCGSDAGSDSGFFCVALRCAAAGVRSAWIESALPADFYRCRPQGHAGKSASATLPS